MNIVGKVSVNMKPVNAIIKAKGLTAGGNVQSFHTQNVIRRIQKYMPYRTGAMIKLMISQSPISGTMVIIDAPGARMLYHGKLMVDPVTGAAGFMDADGQWKSRKGVPKVLSDRPINYDKTKNPQAGAYWDRRLVAAERAVMQADLQRYVEGKR